MKKSQKIKLEKLMLQCLDEIDEQKAASDNLEETKLLIFNALKSLDIDKYSLEIDDESTSKNKTKNKNFTICKRANISYNITELKKTLDKELLNEVINKTWILSDSKKFQKILKRYGVKFSEIKDCLSCEETVKTAKIQELYDVGEIDLNKIKNCYSLKVTEYLGIR